MKLNKALYRLKIREVCTSTASLRQRLGYKSSETLPDLSWKAGWPMSADTFLSLVEVSDALPSVQAAGPGFLNLKHMLSAPGQKLTPAVLVYFLVVNLMRGGAAGINVETRPDRV